jgi:O-antigen/teichoic acid export membrane protein
MESPTGSQTRSRLIYSVGVISNLVAGLLVGTIATHVMLPNDWGALQESLLWASYLSIIGFGVFNAVNRDVAHYHGQGDLNKIQEIINRSWWYAKLNAVIGLFLGIALLGFSYAGSTRPNNYAGVIVFILFAISEPFVQHLDSVCLSFERFRDIGIALIWQAFVQMLGVILIKLYGVTGFVIFRILYTGIRLSSRLSRVPMRHNSSMSMVDLRELIKSGFPLLAVGFAANLFNSFDRLLAALFLGSDSVGILSLATLITSGVAYVPQIVGSIYYPRLTKMFAGAATVSVLADHVRQMLKLCTIIIIPISVIAFILIEPITCIAFPAYVDGIIPAKILTAASMVQASFCLTVIFAVTKKSNILLYLIISSYAVMAIVFGILHERVPGLWSIAIAKALGSMYLAASITVATKNYLSYENKV